MDFDGDGHDDLISGSYDPGEFYLFRGAGGGKFLARETIRDRNGKPVLRVPNQTRDVHSFGSWVSMVDWEEDGDLDLVMGGFHGEIMIRINEGTRTDPRFAVENTPVQIDGEDVRVPGGHAAPVVADWDGDGLWDLVSGSATGAVYWYRNKGTAKAPKLEPPRTLVAEHQGIGYAELLDPSEEPTPGIRSQISVADFDLDGKLDLLMGDFCTNTYARTDLSNQERFEMFELRDELKESSAAVAMYMKTLQQDLAQRFPKGESKSDERMERMNKEYREKLGSEEFKELGANVKRCADAIQEFTSIPESKSVFGDNSVCHGYVWLFLRK